MRARCAPHPGLPDRRDHTRLADIKKTPAPGEVPDCRPIGVPQSDRCCFERAVALAAEEAHVAHLLPEQLGVGVKGGIGVLVHGLRALMEAHP